MPCLISAKTSQPRLSEKAVAFLLITYIATTACSSAVVQQAPPISGDRSPLGVPRNPEPALLEERCPDPEVPTELTVTCFRTEVAGASLAVAILHSDLTPPENKGDPVLYIHGGPGGRAVADRHRWLAPRSLLLAGHDVVLVDQRGGGSSEPSMDCFELDGSVAPSLDLHRACRDRLDGAGIERESVNVARIAADLVRVREALDINRWHIHSVSYGTRIASEMLRIDEEAVSSVVLDSVTPPDLATHDELPSGVVAAVRALGLWCDGPTRRCSQDLPSRLAGVLEGLATEPQLVTIHSGETLWFNDVRFLSWFTRVLSLPAPEGPAAAAASIDIAESGVRIAEAAALLHNVLSQASENTARNVGDSLSEGAQLSVECADEIPGNSFSANTSAGDHESWVRKVERAVQKRWIHVRALCAIWNVPWSNPETRLASNSTVPALVLSGRLDPITPTAWGHHVATSLSNAVLVTSGTWGHTPSMWNPCAMSLVADFFKTGDRPKIEGDVC